MAWIVLTLFALAIGLIYKLLRDNYTYWEKRGIPFEEPIYGVGNLKGLGKTRHFRDVYDHLYQRYKSSAPFVGLYFFFSKIALLTDLDLIKHVLIKDFSNFTDRNVFHNERDDPLSAHLFSIAGEAWRAMRTKLTPVFTSGKMKFMFPTVVGVSEILVKASGAQLKESGSRSTIEVKEICARFTTDVIGTCAFGIECNSLEDPKAEFRSRGRSLFEQPRHNTLVTGFMFNYPKLARYLRMKLFSDEVSDFFIDAVKSTVEYRVKNGVKRNDFMDLLIEMMAKDQKAAEQGGGIDLSHGLTLLQMAAQAFVFFVAGFDTSSTTMSLCLYELALHEDMQEKVRQEIDSVLAKYSGKLSYEAIQDMSYLDQVVAETLRKYPILPHLERMANHDYHVPNTKYTIEKGTTVFIPLHSIHHDPAIYPDPEKFDPSRFTPEEIQQRHAAAYLPFGDGPRNCIGMRFGKMQTKIGLIALLKNYKFSKSSTTEDPVIFSNESFLLATQNGIHLNIERV